mmetsp:Transcript_16944/g.29313  ORF Transcript_16944/g.29313 Transcript_16944/m.29313 type:complete len:599 (-) Transcript_16944:1199-2995(-)
MYCVRWVVNLLIINVSCKTRGNFFNGSPNNRDCMRRVRLDNGTKTNIGYLTQSTEKTFVKLLGALKKTTTTTSNSSSTTIAASHPLRDSESGNSSREPSPKHKLATSTSKELDISNTNKLNLQDSSRRGSDGDKNSLSHGFYDASPKNESRRGKRKKEHTRRSKHKEHISDNESGLSSSFVSPSTSSKSLYDGKSHEDLHESTSGKSSGGGRRRSKAVVEDTAEKDSRASSPMSKSTVLASNMMGSSLRNAVRISKDSLDTDDDALHQLEAESSRRGSGKRRNRKHYTKTVGASAHDSSKARLENLFGGGGASGPATQTDRVVDVKVWLPLTHSSAKTPMIIKTSILSTMDQILTHLKSSHASVLPENCLLARVPPRKQPGLFELAQRRKGTPGQRSLRSSADMSALSAPPLQPPTAADLLNARDTLQNVCGTSGVAELRVIERDQLSRVFERRGSGGKAVSPHVRKTSAYSNSARMRASSITSMISPRVQLQTSSARPELQTYYNQLPPAKSANLKSSSASVRLDDESLNSSSVLHARSSKAKDRHSSISGSQHGLLSAISRKFRSKPDESKVGCHGNASLNTRLSLSFVYSSFEPI